MRIRACLRTNFYSFPRSGVGTQMWPLQQPGPVTLERQRLAPTPERGSQMNINHYGLKVHSLED